MAKKTVIIFYFGGDSTSIMGVYEVFAESMLNTCSKNNCYLNKTIKRNPY